MHGTSHGVGSFLSVHENLGGGLVENMIMSNEPGFYEPGIHSSKLNTLTVTLRYTCTLYRLILQYMFD